SAEAGKARLTGTRHALSVHIIGLDLGDQEYPVTLTRDRMPNQFLGTAAAVISRRIDQGHAERKACAQRLLFSGWRMSSLPKMPRALTKCRDDRAVREPYRPPGTCQRDAGNRINNH